MNFWQAPGRRQSRKREGGITAVAAKRSIKKNGVTATGIGARNTHKTAETGLTVRNTHKAAETGIAARK